MTEPLCTCGKRPKHKCCEENEQKVGRYVFVVNLNQTT